MTRTSVPLAIAAERIRARVETNDSTGCWEWPGGTNGSGYGRVWVGDRKLYVHRVMYEASVGPIPHGLQIDHLCRNPICCNPLHLEPVTRRENVLRGLTSALKTHCKHGHPWVPENIYTYDWRGKTIRHCRVCRISRQRRSS